MLAEKDLDRLRWTIAATPPVAALLFWRATQDVFGVTKATVVALATTCLLVWVLVVGLRDCVLRIRTHPALWMAAAFLAAAAFVTITSDAPAASSMGRIGRHSGLLMYLVYATLFGFTITAFTAERATMLLGGVLLATFGVAGYALVQRVGVDPWAWGQMFGHEVIASTVGNPNYVAAHLAIGVPAALWGVLNRRWPQWGRIGAAVVGLLAVAALTTTDSDQGPIAAAAGIAVVGVAALRTRPGRVRQLGPAAIGLVAATAATIVLLGVFGIGPMDRLAGKWSTELRGYQWSSAAAMIADRPILGVGFDRYGAYDGAYRSPEAAAALRVGLVDAAPHNVPLNMFVSGGLILGLAYLAFVGIVGWILVRGLFTLEGRPLLVLGGLGGSWAGYQAQAVVSVDIPSLAVTHWILAGGIVVVAGAPRWRQIELPWGPSTSANRRKHQKRQPTPTGVWLGVGLIAVVGLLAMIQLTRPLRADLAAAEAVAATERQDIEPALTAGGRAVSLAPWEPRYHYALAVSFIRAGRNDEAFAVLQSAVEHDPRNLQAVLGAAQLAELAGDTAEAARWYRRAVALEPHHADVLEPAAAVLAQHGAVEEAEELLDAAVQPRRRGGDES